MPYFTLETEPNTVLLALKPLLMATYEALEQAIPSARQVITDNGYHDTGGLFSHLVRAEVKKLLDGRSCPVELEENPYSVRMQPLAMEGLLTDFDGIKVRILKGATVPKPCSEPRRAFYQQVNPALWVGQEAPPIFGLLVLWNCTPEGNKIDLQLCCTKDKEGEDHWMAQVPHPAEWMTITVPAAQEDDDFEGLLDEPIKKKVIIN